MSNLSVNPSTQQPSGGGSSRSGSPARHHDSQKLLNATKKSEPSIVVGANKSRRKSPVSARKSGGPLAGTGPPSESTPLSPPPCSGNAQTPSATPGAPSTGDVTITGGGDNRLVGATGTITIPAAWLAADDLQIPSNLDDSELLPDGANLSNGSSSELLVPPDDVDFASLSATPEIHRTRLAIDHIQLKIQRTKEMIRQEQTARDENVNEYLKLAANADKQQLHRIKQVFEKKNTKSAQTISQLQKKLDNYNKRIRELEMYGIAIHRQPKEVLRDMGQGLKDVGANIRDGITGFSGGVVGNIKDGLSGLSQATQSAAETVMSKPREFAHLIKNKFGSADNINTMTKSGDEGMMDEPEKNHHNSATFTHSARYTSDDECSSVTSGSGPITGGTGTMSSPRNQPPQTSSSAQGSVLPVPITVSLDPILQQLHERREECTRLQEDIDSLKLQMQQEITYYNQALQEERYRYERLEEQMNDLIELHQNEIENLKQGISDMEEKVQYQNEERVRDLHEMMESCHTRISRMEHQQHQQQQLVTLEGIENSTARALVLKLVNIVLTLLQVILLLVATTANILTPFIRTRFRLLSSLVIAVIAAILYRQWPELLHKSLWLIHRYTGLEFRS